MLKKQNENKTQNNKEEKNDIVYSDIKQNKDILTTLFKNIV